MAACVEGESVSSELSDSIQEIEDGGQRSDYSLEFDDDLDSPVPGQRGAPQDGESSAQSSIAVVGVESAKHLQRRAQEDGGRTPGGLASSTNDDDNDDGIPDLCSSSSFNLMARRRPGAAQRANTRDHQEHQQNPPPTRTPGGAPIATAEESTDVGSKAPRNEDRQHRERLLPVQVLEIRSRLNGLLQHGDSRLTATEAFRVTTKEHAALRDCLGDVERELLKARRKVADDAAARLRAAQEKRARAEARRVRHFEQLGEARRVAAVANAEAEALRARLGDRETELQHTRDMLETARSAASTAEERADRCQMEASEAEVRSKDLSEELSKAREKAEEETRRGEVTARDSQDKIELCERKRELEVDAAVRAAEAREQAAEEQLNRLPEHHQQLLQAELDRVTRWEERLAAEAASLQRREEAHKIEREAWRAQAARTEAESRARAEEDVSRERSSLKEARSALDAERGELLRRVARAEAAGQAAAAKATAARAEADDARRRVEAERGAMEIRAATLAPEVRALEESRAALEGLQRGARDEAQRAKEKACNALEMESEVVQREAAVEVKWEEIMTSRRALKQMEKSVADEAEGLSEQRKAVGLARVRLHEQQMEMALQMSEIRKALALIKRVDTVEDAPARRMALELGALACDRGEMAARRAEKIEMVDAGPDRGLGEGLGRLAGGSVALTGGNSCRRAESGPRADVGDATRLIALPSQACKLAGVGDGAATAPVTPILVVDDTRVMGHTRVDANVMRRGGGAYAGEAIARETLEKVRFVLASTGDGWQGSSGAGGGADEGGGGGWGGSVQSWTTKLQAAAVATGARRSF